MFAPRSLRRHCLKTLSSLLQSNPYKNVVLLKDESPKIVSSNVMQPSVRGTDSVSSLGTLNFPFNVCFRQMSTSRGRSMRSKVEARMKKESGKTLKEIRRAKKFKLKLMDDNERLLYNLKRAKKKVALLLQKLKKYELPELPPSVHDPELFTPEQLQAYKKIGFKNKNYVPVGVRGVFGGVVQNMHLHWKFHETVQVCCDNFPKEKIKEMATMLTRLSGGIAINIHNTKTIIMFRGRNYRQPKNLIPFNTLTKRKALFKARFEQALESQKLNIKKIEQELRKKGINPEDPVAMASIQRVASTFFNAIDKKEGSPYVFQADKLSVLDHKNKNNVEQSEPPIDSDQEDLDQFIAEIEDAADKEWAEEEEAEKEEQGQLRYWNKDDIGGRFRRPEGLRNDADIRGERGRMDTRGRKRTADSDDDDDDNSEGDDEWDSDSVGDVNAIEIHANNSREAPDEFKRSRVERKPRNVRRVNDDNSFKRNTKANFVRKMAEEDSDSENMLSDLENAMWESDAEEGHDLRESGAGSSHNYRSSSSEEDDIDLIKGNERNGVSDYNRYADNSNEAYSALNISRNLKGRKQENIGRADINNSGSEDVFSDTENATGESDSDKHSTVGRYNYRVTSEEEQDYQLPKKESNEVNQRKAKTSKELDETWDSD
ncbi:CRS1_YhbY domain-containing protein [Cephalotus follicularis]|uniref:CRS1_YhbY domain-containing protein n=1 Tax=Cephalotus follicularis TaxID=3775 RepID=A0A1Q3CEQ4_CEPFO|nr:CRS1_YhbY domain-containing protein [Cephalotus follicularis]